jgi:hypothetical protein
MTQQKNEITSSSCYTYVNTDTRLQTYNTFKGCNECTYQQGINNDNPHNQYFWGIANKSQNLRLLDLPTKPIATEILNQQKIVQNRNNGKNK